MIDYQTTLGYAKILGILPRISKNDVKYINYSDVDEKKYKNNNNLYLMALLIKEYALSRTLEYEYSRLQKYNKDPQMKKALKDVRTKKLSIELKKIQNIIKLKEKYKIERLEKAFSKDSQKSFQLNTERFEYIPDNNLPCYRYKETEEEQLNRQISTIENNAKEKQDLLTDAENDYVQHNKFKVKVKLIKRQ